MAGWYIPFRGALSENIPINGGTISRWISNFESENNKPAFMKTSEDIQSLQTRIKELEAQIEEQRIRAEFYDEMINVAEAKFNIPIRKKTDPKL